MRDGAAEDEAARLDTRDLVDLQPGIGMHQLVDRPPAEVRPLTSAALADQRVSADGQDGLAAFLVKRPARWVIEP